MKCLGKKELASLKIDFKIYQMNSSTTKCCAGGTRDATSLCNGNGIRPKTKISTEYDETDPLEIKTLYGSLRF